MLLDGAVELTNRFGQLSLRSGDGAVAKPDKPPERTAMLEAMNIVQWCLYYPAVLDADELSLAEALTGSLAAYRSGDLLAALAKYPDGRQPGSNQEKVYRASLLLA